MSRQVLVIEDDDDIAQLIRLQLAGFPCTVKPAGGDIAVQRAQRKGTTFVIRLPAA